MCTSESQFLLEALEKQNNPCLEGEQGQAVLQTLMIILLAPHLHPLC